MEQRLNKRMDGIPTLGTPALPPPPVLQRQTAMDYSMTDTEEIDGDETKMRDDMTDVNEYHRTKRTRTNLT